MPKPKRNTKQDTRLRLDPKSLGHEIQSLSDQLHDLVIGQDEAIKAILDAYQVYTAGMNAPRRPVGSFLFLGPTGTGKTRTVEAFAEVLHGNENKLIRVNCGEFQLQHEIAKFIGAPPGYIGHKETAPVITQDKLKDVVSGYSDLSIVLFDEIEKVEVSMTRLLLGILDKGTLRLGDSKEVSFAKTMVFMTSNLGMKEMSDLIKPALGFGGVQSDKNLESKINERGVSAVRKHFSAEFFNRIDKIVTFRSLGTEEIRDILNIELDIVRDRIERLDIEVLGPGRAFSFTITDRAKEFILSQGVDKRYGARNLKRTIDRLLTQPLAGIMASGQISGGDTVDVDLDPSLAELVFFRANTATKMEAA